MQKSKLFILVAIMFSWISLADHGRHNPKYITCKKTKSNELVIEANQCGTISFDEQDCSDAERPEHRTLPNPRSYLASIKNNFVSGGMNSWKVTQTSDGRPGIWICCSPGTKPTPSSQTGCYGYDFEVIYTRVNQ